MINVWTQPWIHLTTNPYISTYPPLGLESLKVDTLINHAQGSWRLEIIDQILNANDKHVVTS